MPCPCSCSSARLHARESAKVQELLGREGGQQQHQVRSRGCWGVEGGGRGVEEADRDWTLQFYPYPNGPLLRGQGAVRIERIGASGTREKEAVWK